MAALRKWLRRLRSLLWTSLSLLILLAAVLVGLGKLFMPYSAQFKPRLEAWLSEEFNQPVRVESFSGEWMAFGPRITLEDMELLGEGDRGGAVALRRAALDIRPLNALISGRPLYTFRVIGADLSLEHLPDGRFELSGFGVNRRGGDGEAGFGNLARLGEVQLQDSSFGYVDERRGLRIQLVRVNGRLQMDGRRLALEVQAGLSDAVRERVLGDLGATVLVTLDRDQRLASARWHVETGEFMMPELAKGLPEHALMPESGRLNARIWGEWSPGEPQRMEGVLDIRDGSLAAEPQPLRVAHLNTRFRWRFNHRRQWRLDLADLRLDEGGRRWSAGELAIERNIPGGLGSWVGGDTVQAAFPMAVTRRIMAIFDARWPKNLPLAADGQVSDFDILIDADKQFVGARGRFDNLAASEWGRWPDVTGITGSADLMGGEGTVRFSGEDVIVDWPANFRARAELDIPACELEILWGARWQVDARGCAARNASADLRARLRFAQTEGKPFVDLRVVASRLDLGAMGDYWPARLVKAPVRDWLARSLRAGDVTDGRFRLRGDLDDFPFRAGEGSLDAVVEVSGGVLDFQPGWPAAEAIDATVRFHGAGMTVDGGIGSIGGAQVDTATARIDDFQAALLDIDYRTRDPLTAFAGFLTATPLIDEDELSLDPFGFEGEGGVAGMLRIPLGSTTGETTIDGTLSLDGNTFTETRSGLRIDDLGGDIRFGQSGFTAEDLAAEWGGQPALLDLTADWGAEPSGQGPFRATLKGVFPAATLASATPLAGDALLARAEGDTAWRIAFEVGPQSATRRDLWLTVESDLHGISLDLPAPLDKSADEAWPMSVRWPLRASAPIIDVRVDGRIAMLAEMAAGAGGTAGTPPDGAARNHTRLRRGALHFGGGSAHLPEPGLFDVRGEVGRFDLDGWMGVFVEHYRAGRYPDGLALGSIDLEADGLVMMDRVFPGVMVRVEQQDDTLRARFDSVALAGDIRYSRTPEGAQSLSAQMERVLMPEPIESGMTMDTDPSLLPELHIYMQSFRYRGLDLGEARIEAYPVADGLRIESVEAASDHVTFQARGDWVSTAAGSRSDFDMVLTSESLGELIDALDLSSALEGGQTMVHYDAWWPGSPAAFDLAVLNGEMTFSIIDGRILNAEPGAGRVLGLMSVAALPRRLTLDFSDVFESGFSFDQAGARVSLESGIARTDDFTMASPAATLSIAGNADMVDKTFDYQMVVRPGVSQALPVLGAIAAGPTGAAAGLALQGLLRDALGSAAEARYAIKGPWSDPDVQRLQTQSAATQRTDPAKPPGPR